LPGEIVSEERQEIVHQLSVYGNVGLTFVAAVLLGFGAGWAADNRLFAGGTAPWLTLAGLVVGIAAGFRSLWALTRTVRNDR